MRFFIHIKNTLAILWIAEVHIVMLLFFICSSLLFSCSEKKGNAPIENTQSSQLKTESEAWVAPDINSLGNTEHDQLIKYGKKLIENTAYYLGPHGTVAHLSNGMNCQNCHLAAGTKPFGNNYSAVAANYPKYRERSGSIESVYKRVNDCFERSLNGQPLDTLGHEMQAIKAYIAWLGKDVPKGNKPAESGIMKLAYLDQAANPDKGKTVYLSKCATCHTENGSGKLNTDHITYLYPPLWGPHSYTSAAGLFRLSLLAGYVKANMPFGVDYTNPQLSDEEAWNVAAYINSQPRPDRDISKDWPKIASKPVDYPFAPYTDTFAERQHKYGPYAPIAAFKQQNK